MTPSDAMQQAIKAYERQDWTLAAQLCARVPPVGPQHLEALYLLGLIAFRERRFEEAAELFGRILAVRPDDARACYNGGVALQELGRHDAAIASFDRAIAIDPGHSEAFGNKGVALQALGRHQAAIASFDRAIAIHPDFAGAHFNRGVSLRALGQPDAALASFDRAIAIRPGLAAVHNNRGNVLQQLGRADEAVASFDRAIAIDPGHAAAHNNRGNALRDLGDVEAAVASYERATALNPEFAEAHGNLGLALQELGKLDAAISSFDRAIAIRPDFAEAHWKKAFALLLKGDLADGWALYEWRWKREDTRRLRRSFAQPLWLGAEPLKGRTLLLHSEQGLGDTLQFCRYATLAAERGARVILEAPAELAGLLRGLDGVSQVIEAGGELPVTDLHCPLMSLPLAFGTTLATIPAPVRYLRGEPGRKAAWEATLGGRSGLRVGLAWRGGAGHVNDRNRSIPLGILLRSLPVGIDFISLQQEVRADDRAALQASPIRHVGDELHDFNDTAALCETVDLVVTVDTSVAHLAGALGKRVWILLPWLPDWRWLLEREDSPWYRSATLFRQKRRGDWECALDKLGRDMAILARDSQSR